MGNQQSHKPLRRRHTLPPEVMKRAVPPRRNSWITLSRLSVEQLETLAGQEPDPADEDEVSRHDVDTLKGSMSEVSAPEESQSGSGSQPVSSAEWSEYEATPLVLESPAVRSGGVTPSQTAENNAGYTVNETTTMGSLSTPFLEPPTAYRLRSSEFIKAHLIDVDTDLDSKSSTDSFVSPDELSRKSNGSSRLSSDSMSFRKRINRWKMGDQIGKGSFGTVYMGLDLESGGLIAVKEIPYHSDSVMEMRNLSIEINLMRTLEHPNIVCYYGTEVLEDKLHIFTEWCPGGSISGMLKKFGALEEHLVSLYTHQLLTGLAYLHDYGIIHRDIKCENLLVDASGNVKVADFGASTKLNSMRTTIAPSELRGTPYFMAPEVIRHEAYGKPADIWSVGCAVLQMATGNPPWKSMNFQNANALLYYVGTSGEIPEIPDTLSESLKHFLQSCFQREPEARYQVEELLLDSFISGHNTSITEPASGTNTDDGNDDDNNEISYNCNSSLVNLDLLMETTTTAANRGPLSLSMANFTSLQDSFLQNFYPSLPMVSKQILNTCDITDSKGTMIPVKSYVSTRLETERKLIQYLRQDVAMLESIIMGITPSLTGTATESSKVEVKTVPGNTETSSAGLLSGMSWKSTDHKGKAETSSLVPYRSLSNDALLSNDRSNKRTTPAAVPPRSSTHGDLARALLTRKAERLMSNK